MEISTSVPETAALYGLGERTSSTGLELRRDGIPLALWNRDHQAALPDQNVYGSHPILMDVREGNASSLACMSSFCAFCFCSNDLLQDQISELCCSLLHAGCLQASGLIADCEKMQKWHASVLIIRISCCRWHCAWCATAQQQCHGRCADTIKSAVESDWWCVGFLLPDGPHSQCNFGPADNHHRPPCHASLLEPGPDEQQVRSPCPYASTNILVTIDRHPV